MSWLWAEIAATLVLGWVASLYSSRSSIRVRRNPHAGNERLQDWEHRCAMTASTVCSAAAAVQKVMGTPAGVSVTVAAISCLLNYSMWRMAGLPNAQYWRIVHMLCFAALFAILLAIVIATK